MELEQYNFSVEENQENSLKDILLKYVYNWKWFLLSIIVSLCLGYVYLKSHPPLYEVNATILIKDDQKGGSVSDELSAFEDLGIFKGKGNIDNEIEILKSRSLMTKVVQELKLNVSYFSKGRPIEHERYFDTPISANYIVKDSTQLLTSNWILIAESKTKFKLKNEEEDLIGTYEFGEPVNVAFGKVIFTTTSFFSESYINNNFRVMIAPINVAVDNI
jgi:tyrosine-protein kinase Etk/Wzc